MATEKEFPSYLPTPLRNGYGLKAAPTFARTSMASGRAKQRPVNTSVPTMVPVAFLLTQEQAQLFEAWFNYEISYGTEWFNCQLDSPMGLRPYECRFTGMYEGPKLRGLRHWEYSAELEIRERPVLTEEYWLYGQPFIRNQSIIDIALNSLWPEP